MAVPEALTRKVGPLPLGVWLLAVAGGLAISLSRRSSQAAPATAAQYLAANTTGDGEIQTPDEAAVVLTPIFQLPETPVVQAPGVVVRIIERPELPGVLVDDALLATVPFAAPAGVQGAAPAPAAPAPARTSSPRRRVTAPRAPKVDRPRGSYTVKSGDTLWAIAAARMGSGAKWPRLYAENQAVIEREARRRGRSGSAGGHWIYPGTVLVIP